MNYAMNACKAAATPSINPEETNGDTWSIQMIDMYVAKSSKPLMVVAYRLQTDDQYTVVAWKYINKIGLLQ